MDENNKQKLVDEHVRLTAQFTDGNTGAAKRLAEIERLLDMTAADIMHLAIKAYGKEY